MTIALIPGEFWADARVVNAGNAAAGAFARLVSYCAKYKIDRVPQHILEALFWDEPGTIMALVFNGLLIEVDGEYAFDPMPIFVATPTVRAERMRRADGHATDAQVRARVEFYGGLCWICRAVPWQAIDHVKPIAAGGSKWPANLRPVCTSCNSRKGARWPFDAAEVLG